MNKVSSFLKGAGVVVLTSGVSFAQEAVTIDDAVEVLEGFVTKAAPLVGAAAALGAGIWLYRKIKAAVGKASN